MRSSYEQILAGLFNFQTPEPYFPPNSVIYIVSPEDPVLNPRLSLNQIFDGFCLCDLDSKPTNNCDNLYKEIVPLEPSKTGKKKWIEEYDFSDKIELLSGVIQGLLKPGDNSVQKIIIKSKRKSNNAKGKKWSKRRSSFIGVSRNGTSYQVLIAVNGRKTYLGSFDDEREAALTFDFYSILLHSVEANTNFSYTAYNIREMIKNYKLFNNSFNASYYLQSNALI